MHYIQIIAYIVIYFVCITGNRSDRLFRTSYQSDTILAIIFWIFLMMLGQTHNNIYFRICLASWFIIFCWWLRNRSFDREILESMHKSLKNPNIKSPL
jgi:hypothetical protein